MKTRCFSRGNENQRVHVEVSVRHHPLQIPIPMLEKKIQIQQENLYEITLTGAQNTLILQQLLGKYKFQKKLLSSIRKYVKPKPISRQSQKLTQQHN